MSTGHTVGTLMDHMAKLDPDAHVITDIGEVIFTLAPEPSDVDIHARVAAMTHRADHADPTTVDDIRAMFAYYNVATPRSNNTNGACRKSRVLLRPTGFHIRHIATITQASGLVTLVTTPV